MPFAVVQQSKAKAFWGDINEQELLDEKQYLGVLHVGIICRQTFVSRINLGIRHQVNSKHVRCFVGNSLNIKSNLSTINSQVRNIMRLEPSQLFYPRKRCCSGGETQSKQLLIQSIKRSCRTFCLFSFMLERHI